MNKRIALEIVVLLVGCAPALTAQETTDSMRVEADSLYLRSGVDFESTTAQGGFAGILKQNARSGGMVTRVGCADPPRYALRIPAGMSFAAALNIITSTYPDNYWTLQGAAFNLLRKQDLPSVMDIPVQRFEWDTAADALPPVNRLLDSNGIRGRLSALGMVPALEYGPGLQRPPRIRNGVPEARQGRKWMVENVTVLTALNAIVSSYGDAYWLYEERKCRGENTYRLSAR